MSLLEWAGDNPGEAVGLASRIGAAWSKDKNATRNVNQAYNTSLADVERTELRGVVQALNKLPGDIFKDPEKMSMALHGIHQQFPKVNPDAFNRVVQSWQSTKVGMQNLLQNQELFPLQKKKAEEDAKQGPIQTGLLQTQADTAAKMAPFQLAGAQQGVDLNKEKLLDAPVNRAKTVAETDYLNRDKGKMGGTGEEKMSEIKAKAMRNFLNGNATPEELAIIGQGEDRYFRDALQVVMQSEEGMKLWRKSPDEGYQIIRQMADQIKRSALNQGPAVDPAEQAKEDKFMQGFKKWSGTPQQ